MTKLAQYLDAEAAGHAVASLTGRLGTDEFVQIRNIDYMYAPSQVYPLAPRVTSRLPRIAAFAVDMDGTSTTTEPLALHALEYMVRRFTGLLTPAEWSGLDRIHDYPHVIGNSNFRHAEFLLERYRDRLDPIALRDAFFEAVAWTLASMTDVQRRRDITRNAVNCGLKLLLDDTAFQRLVTSGPIDDHEASRIVQPFVKHYGAAFKWDHAGALVPTLLDIYYMRYHGIMRRIEQGRGDELSRELLGEAGRLLIEPMPGYEVFVALVKGWLADQAGKLHEIVKAPFESQESHRRKPHQIVDAAALAHLGEAFYRSPAKLALVTASIGYEAHTTMREVFRVMALRVRDWPVSHECRDRVLRHLGDYLGCFDAFVTASDACEHRLKPHPDLYSLALARMGIAKGHYGACVGLEDTEPGIISLRAAGVGCALALPNHETCGQDYSAAAHIIKGGLPDLMLVHQLFLQRAEAAA